MQLLESCVARVQEDRLSRGISLGFGPNACCPFIPAETGETAYGALRFLCWVLFNHRGTRRSANNHRRKLNSLGAVHAQAKPSQPASREELWPPISQTA